MNAPGWRRPRARTLVLGLLVAALVLAGLDALSGPGGPTSSSYATAPNGVAAWAELLQREGHPVTRLRTSPDRELPPASDTLVVLDPDVLVPAQIQALRDFVTGGGRLVAGGHDPQRWVDGLLPRPPQWSARGSNVALALAPAPEVAGVRTVRSSGQGSWSDPGSTRAVLGGGGGALLVVGTIGGGQVALLADSSPLQNRLLDQADNAALAYALAGEPGRPVAFLETVHGYGQQHGLGALPARWRWALLGLVLAALVWLGAHVRRLGPPERDARPLPPPRRAHVDALATLLTRTRPAPEAAADPVRTAARQRLVRRASLDPEPDGAAMAIAARRLGLPDDEVRALTEPIRDDVGALAAGRALARLSDATDGRSR